jgi:hypothetical protein
MMKGKMEMKGKVVSSQFQHPKPNTSKMDPCIKDFLYECMIIQNI